MTLVFLSSFTGPFFTIDAVLFAVAAARYDIPHVPRETMSCPMSRHKALVVSHAIDRISDCCNLFALTLNGLNLMRASDVLGIGELDWN